MSDPTTRDTAATSVIGPGGYGCCGKPKGCGITSAGCPFMNHKRRTWRSNAALPTCAVCGQGERSSRHLSIHPEYHPFTEAQSA